MVFLCIFIAVILAVFATIFANRKIHNKPQKKRRKRLVILLCSLLLTILLILIIVGSLTCDNMDDFIIYLKETLLAKYFIAQMICLVVIYIYAYLKKDEKQRS